MQTSPLHPFGIEVTAAQPGADISTLPIPQIKTWLADHSLAIFRGFTVGPDEAMLAFCRGLGEVLEWEFGAVNELKAAGDAKNYLYTNRAVPFHWDGAFVGRVPHYIFFQCQAAPETQQGGETIFCDTLRLLDQASPEQRQRWSLVRITYTTEKIVHYGGIFTAALLSQHPVSNQAVLRFAEPVEDLNPVRLAIAGLPAEQHLSLLAELRKLLYDPAYCYAHAWKPGDVVLADNHALLHGRNAFTGSANRHLRRVNVL